MSADQAPVSVDLAVEPDFTLGALEVRPSSREVLDSGEREVLEPRVMQVLVALARRRGQVVSRDQLIEECWAGRVVGEDAINRCIARVRRLAEAHGGFAIETIARVGYRLTEQPGAARPNAASSPAEAEPAAPAVASPVSSPPTAAVEQHAPPENRTPTRANAASAPAASRQGRWTAVFVVVAILLAVASFIGVAQVRSQQRSQQAKALAEIAALVSKDQYGAAFVLAQPLSRIESVRTNPAFAELWRQIVVPMRPLVSQAGAAVHFKSYDDVDGEWIFAGTTPLKEWVEAPRGALRLKVTKAGFRTGYFVVAVPGPSVEAGLPKQFPFDVPSVPLTLVEEGKLPDEMVFVPRTNVPVYLAGWSTDLLGGDKHDISAFGIARSEVTNRQFKEFVDAGGYASPQYWQDLKFKHNGRELPWSEARTHFVDTTGRPGPAGWQLSTYPNGQDDFPVGGVSWYEAVAYARFRKQMLPTIHHWMRAAFTPYDPMFPTAAAITAQSRFFADGPVSARSERGHGPWGTYHMAGNAREWVWNFAGEDAVALGSGWPEYASNFARVYTADPMSRLPDHGLRLMRTLDESQIDTTLLEPIRLVRDAAFANHEPLSDDAFEAMRFQFTTPRVAPAEVTVNQVEESTLWIAEEIVLKFAAEETTTLYIVRPKAHARPLQPIVYSGVGDCCFMKRPNRDVLEQLQIAGFVVNSGRALVMPIWAGGYERYSRYPTEASAAADRERRIPLQWQHDLSATIDYLESRPDMDAERIGYFGVSRGASFAGAINLAIEGRIDAAVLASGGAWIHSPLHPMIDLINYAPRITIPVLMLSGRYDHIYPYEQSQKRVFNLLGTPADKKAQIAYDTGHFTMPANRVAADVTDWFDRHLGRVRE
jgi:DNA-binding winged helix-turn-helix (wHTH) protein/formylglycine-generating enzyme required for sulfatase activity/dienelactone hydrolase